MLHNILLTGASGYLGGSLLTAWSSANLPPHGALFALVRSDAQADAVRMYGAEPLRIDISDADAVRRSVVKHNITTVLWLIDAVNWEGQILFIDALAEVKRNTGKDVHLIHVCEQTCRVRKEHCSPSPDKRCKIILKSCWCTNRCAFFRYGARPV